MRILVLNPNSSQATTRVLSRVADDWAAASGNDVVTEYLPDAPELLVTQADNELVAGQIWQRIARLADDGFDAMVIACHGDPGLPDGWAVQDRRPVVGMGWASMQLAAAGEGWGVLCVTEEIVADKVEQAAGYGLTGDLIVARGALRRDYETGSNAALGCLVAEVTEIAAAGAASVVLGCGAMSGLAGAVRERVPAAVIEPLAAALDQSVLLACATG